MFRVRVRVPLRTPTTGSKCPLNLSVYLHIHIYCKTTRYVNNNRGNNNHNVTQSLRWFFSITFLSRSDNSVLLKQSSHTTAARIDLQLCRHYTTIGCANCVHLNLNKRKSLTWLCRRWALTIGEPDRQEMQKEVNTKINELWNKRIFFWGRH